MSRLLHCFRKRNATIGGLGQVSRSQSVRRKISSIQTRQCRPPFDDVVDRLRIERAAGNIAPAVNRPKHTAAVDFGGGQPGVQCLHRSAGQIDDVVLTGARIFGAAKMDGERGEGEILAILYWRLDRQLLLAQTGDLAAPAAGEIRFLER